ncbi:sodium-independent sulfate anion transporter-like [Phymastichus coffea]|uniref:sodium-independent sulfate anion transporter-like n=1 Tax=Phymastichus coffea TaxID=108790 RepID=UPI00273A909D|nr:sodium-independent sulfate anion transporter-like [Phymastichus coffea]XP_058797831.1 sodium-independent sulfate anion transporter-like [Phymastichus coffea]
MTEKEANVDEEICVKNTMKRRRIKCSKYVPICKWLPKYNQYQAVGDFIAGITLGLTMIPQSIAYAALAGLSAQYGLYSSFLGGFLYAIFGSVKEISIGATSLMALLTIEYTKGMNIDFVILLTFLSGCIELIMGMLDLGFLVDFISLPVTSGFTSATSVIIVVSQLKGLFGLKFESETLIDSLIKIWENYKDIKLGDTLLGISSIVILLSLRALKDVKLSQDNRYTTIMTKALWFISVGRNALVVLTCSVVSFYMHRADFKPFKLSGQVKSGLPSFNIPRFSTVAKNQTYGFLDMCSYLGSGIIVVPLVSVLANVAIAKVFASGAAVNASQEMRTLGLCNLVGSCASSMPTCGAFTRSAVSHASGIQTPFAGIYSGLMTIFALSFLTPYFYYIPKAVLSAVLISAVGFLIDWKIVYNLWRGSKKDAVATIGTFTVCVLFNVETGLLLGIIFNIIYLLYLSARPAIKVTECMTNLEHKYLLIQPDVGLFFPAVDFLVNKISEVADERADDGKVPLVLDCQRFRGIDYTAVKGLEKLAKDFRDKEQKLWFLNLNDKVAKSIKKLGDLNNLKILKNEADIVAVLCGLEMDDDVQVQYINEYNGKNISMSNMIASTSLEAESLIVKENKVDSEAKIHVN